jgi:hypothetical protein
MAFRLLDLPGDIRMRIYGFALGFKVIHVEGTPQSEGNTDPESGFTYSICDSSSAPDISPKYAEVEVCETIYKCTVPAMPSCEYMHFEDASTNGSLELGLLRACKQTYAEAKIGLFADNLFTFTTWDGFTNFFINPPGGPLRAAAITKLSFLVDPKTPQAHFLNETIGELYLPDGTMSDPKSRFPALKLLHLVIGPSGCESPKFTEWERWSTFMWIWAFSYFAIEELNDVSIAMSSEYVIRNRNWDGQGAEDAIGEGMKWSRPSDEELNKYEYEVRRNLLRDWMGGDQDDVELRHLSYDNRTAKTDFWAWEP